MKQPALGQRLHTLMIRLLVASLFIALSAHAADKPNIVFILADDLGIGDLGCYGQKMFATPNIDRLAAEGMKFTRHYAGCTVCAPSRCVLMTGLHTGHCRVRGNGPWTIPDGDLTVPKLLKQAGYTTACFGKYGLGKPLPEDDPQRKGFDEFYGYVDTSHAHNFYPTFLIHNGERFSLPNVIIPNSGGPAHEDTGVATKEGRKVWAPGLIAESVQSFLVSPRAKAKPFFLYYALNLPHANNEAKKDSPLGHGLESPDYGEFANKDWPDVEKGFASLVRFLDDQVGAVLATLKAEGLDENTLVLFSSDNGAHAEGLHDSDFFNSNADYNGIKRSLTDGGIRVPMIARWPGKIKAGAVSDHVSGFQDLLPTAAALSGAALSDSTDGISMLPTLTGKGSQVAHDYLFWNFDEQGGKRAVLQWPWKLIHLNTGAVAKGGKGKAKGKVASMQVQLFNLDHDSGEETNVAAQHPDVVRSLEAKMKEAWQEPNVMP
jgi:arylsulfatase A-like enzyme